MTQGDALETDFAERLQLALNGCNLSRSQLSATLGVHKSLVSRWLSGDVKPTSYNLARISEMLARLRPGFNMTLWTAPLAEFEAALGLQPVAPKPAPLPRRRHYIALGSALVIALIAGGFLLRRSGDGHVASNLPDTTQHSGNRAEAIRLTQAAHALVHERNRTSIAEAEHLLRQAVAADPSYAPAWARLGHAVWFPWWSAEQNDPGAKLRLKAEAIAYVKRALAIAPDLAEAQGVMGMLLTDTNEGVPWLERAVQLDSDSAELWMWLGDGRLGQRDLKGALEAYQKAHSLDPAWARPEEAYLNIVFRLRGAADAYRELDAMARTTNDQNWALQMRADLAYEEGRLTDSAKQAITALRFHPQNPYWARNGLVSIASLLGNKALQERILAEDPLLRVNFNALEKPGWAFERAQRSPETWWDGTHLGAQASQLVSEGRSALLVSLYDRRFRKPAEFLSNCPAVCNAISAAPALIIALRSVKRDADAQQILTGAANSIRQLEASGDRSFHTELSQARVAALSRDAAGAKRRLRDAVQQGWKGQDTGLPDPAADPAFAGLQADTEFQAIVKSLRASQHAEAEKLARLDMSGI